MSECYTFSQDGLATEKMTKLSSVNGPFINICISSFQAVATYDLRFLHVFAGWPGRSADGSVLKHSPLSKTLPQLMNNNSEYLTDTYHIIGDKAFPLTRHILTPYRKSQRRSRTMAQKIYNKHLASKRQVSSNL